MKGKQALAISAILLAALSLQGEKQSAAAPDKPSATHTGKLQGHITNTSGEPVKDATIVLTDTSTREASRTKTDSKGEYTFSELFPGSYSVNAEAKGYKPASAETRIKNGNVATVDLKLANE
jgi:protocatechuate 3,4-dioxygenase beta subunit